MKPILYTLFLINVVAQIFLTSIRKFVTRKLGFVLQLLKTGFRKLRKLFFFFARKSKKRKKVIYSYFLIKSSMLY